MAMIVSLPHYDFFCWNFWSRGEKNVSEAPPPPPRWASFSGLTQNFMARAAVARLLAILPPPKQTPWRRPCIYPSKKVTQLDFDRLYFFSNGFIFVMLDITWKSVYFPFYWCLICYDCIDGVCVGWVNWGQCQKWKVAKFDWIVRWYVMFCVRSVMHNCLTEIRQNKISCWISNTGAILQHLIFSSPEPKAQVSYCRPFSSVVRRP